MTLKGTTIYFKNTKLKEIYIHILNKELCKIKNLLDSLIFNQNGLKK